MIEPPYGVTEAKLKDQLTHMLLTPVQSGHKGFYSLVSENASRRTIMGGFSTVHKVVREWMKISYSNEGLCRSIYS